MPVIGITSCHKLEDYRQAVLHAGGEVRILEPAMGVEGALDLLGDGTAGAQHNAITWPGATRAADPAVGSSHKTGERGCPVRAEAKRGRHVG